MNNKSLFWVLVAAAVVGGLLVGVVGHFLAPMVGGDFAGGIVPNNLWSGNSTTNSVSPISGLPNILTTGSLSAGGIATNNQVTALYTAVATYPWTPSSTSAITIASSTFTAAQTSTQIAFVSSGFAVNDVCEVRYDGTTSTLFTTGLVTAVSGSNVTTTVTFLNATGATVPLTVTSTITGVTSTLKATCIHTGV